MTEMMKVLNTNIKYDTYRKLRVASALQLRVVSDHSLAHSKLANRSELGNNESQRTLLFSRIIGEVAGTFVEILQLAHSPR